MFKLKPLLNYDEIWIAVSMGIDSLSLFNFLSNNLHKQIVAFHINHKMIPEDDEIEQNFRNWSKLQPLCKCFTADTIIKFPQGKDSLETWGHRIRHYYYREISDKHRAIVTAHHLNDAVESYVDNFAKGNPEYTPIKEKSKIGNSYIFRPAITVTKKKLNSYLPPEWEKWVYEDPLNKSSKSKRNRIRTLIPSLEEATNTNLEKIVKKKFYL